ncbi:MAG: Ig-like domain-containing protein, partial [Planctomycetota bacterium]
GKGTALLAYERQQAGGGVAVEYRLLREEPDRTPPALAHTRQLAPTRIALVFDEPLDPASVRDASFEIDGLEVKSARFNDRPDALARQVVIETAKATPGRTYRLTVAGLKDRAGNATKPRPLELVVQPGTASPIPFIDRWLILGPFPRDWKMQYVDPAGVRPSPGKAVEIGGRKVTWKTGPMKWQSLLSFNRAFGKPENKVAYAHVYVHSHRARKVMLRLDSNDGNRAWLNGRQVNFDPAERGRGIHTHTNEVTVSLAKGWNRLLVAVGNRRGYWLLVAQFTDASRQPIRDLTYELRDPVP